MTEADKAGLGGGAAGGALFGYTLLRMLQSEAASTVYFAAWCGGKALSGERDGYVSEFCSALLDPNASFVRKLVVVGGPYLILALIAAAIANYVCRKSNWLVDDEGPRFFLGAAVGFFAAVLLTGNLSVVDFILAGKLWNG